jgi:hypothetical protein
MKRATILLVLFLFLLVGTAHAQGRYELVWYAVGGGGGESQGGDYGLSGSMGQPATSAMTGGKYSLEGGFWTGTGTKYLVYFPILLVNR